MKRTLIICAALLVAGAFANGVLACDAKKAEAGDVKVGCPFDSAKAAYSKALADSGCEKTAKEAYKKTLAEESYSKALADSGCAKTASKAAYDAVLKETSCRKSAAAAAQHAVAKAAFNDTLKATGCSMQAQSAYDKSIESQLADAEQIQDQESDGAGEVSS